MRYRNTMLLAIAIFCCDLQVVNSAEQYNNINWDEIYKLPNKEIVHLDDIMYENQKQFITKNNGNIKLELFNFHHKLTVNKLNYMYDSISYENEAAKSCIKKLIEELQNIDNEVTNDTVDDILWNYHELMNENFTKLKNLTKDNEKTIVRTIMNSCLNCTCVTQNYMIEE